MIRPWPDAFRWGKAAFAQRKPPFRFTARTLSQASAVSSQNFRFGISTEYSAALFTRMSSRPNRWTVWSTARCTLASSVTSIASPITSAPSAQRLAAVRSAAAWSMSAAATLTP